MTSPGIKITPTPDGIELSQPSPSKEFSITGKGGRTDAVFINREDAAAVIKALKPFADEANEENSI